MAEHAPTTSTPSRRRRGAAPPAAAIASRPVEVAPHARRDAAAGLTPALRRRLETLAERIIGILDHLDRDPDAEPDFDGEEDVAEASTVPLTLAPDTRPSRYGRARA